MVDDCRLVRVLICTLLLFASAASAAEQQRQSTVQVGGYQINDRRQDIYSCTSGSCSYYSLCLEPQFPCQSSGLVLQYAKKRCEAVERLQHSSMECSTCINNNKIIIWSKMVEECIQEGLRKIITGEFANIKSNVATCQKFERRAIETINVCYRGQYDSTDKPHLCHLLGDEVDEHELSDLKNLVSAFRIGGDYHITTVDSGIPELVRECGHSDIANSLYTGEPTYRLIFCSWAILITSPPPTELQHIITLLTEHLNDSESNFVYGGISLDFCQATPDNTQIDSTLDYHIWTWFASASNMAARNYNGTDLAHFDNPMGRAIVGIYEHSDRSRQRLLGVVRDYSKCGDGIRQAGEECDYALLNSDACTLECKIGDDTKYECSVDRLERSYCWVQECGDGRRTSGESCDDGNLNNSDGCDANCQVEPQYICTDVYNATSVCTI